MAPIALTHGFGSASVHQEGAELSAFIDFLYREAVNKHGLGKDEVTTDFVDVLVEGKDTQLMLEVLGGSVLVNGTLQLPKPNCGSTSWILDQSCFSG